MVNIYEIMFNYIVVINLFFFSSSHGEGYSRYLASSGTQTGDAAYTYGPYNSNVQVSALSIYSTCVLIYSVILLMLNLTLCKSYMLH